MSDRRYDETEVAAIFLRAAESPKSPALPRARSEGLTLADLQEIGKEVGLSAESVAIAAQSVSLEGQAGSQTFLTLPIGVEQTIPLNRRITEDEWELIVVRLREVFNARGTLSSSGSLRQWTNGNLQALLEPTESGHRVRLRTVNGAARARMAGGLIAIGMAGATGIATAANGQFNGSLTGIAILLAMGAGMFAYGALRLPGWARLRRRQMEGIAASIALPKGQ